MKTFTNQAHQGDVYLHRVTALPPTAKPQKPNVKGRVMLALGETSGHHHSLMGRVALFRDDGGSGGATFFLKVEKSTPLEHLNAGDTPTYEHDTIVVEPGIYALPQQQEWTDDDEPIQVAD